MKSRDVTLEQLGDHFVVTELALSPKLGGGWEQFFWTGPRDDGAAVWTQDPDQAAEFPDADTAAIALQSLSEPVTVAPFQHALFGADQ